MQSKWYIIVARICAYQLVLKTWVYHDLDISLNLSDNYVIRGTEYMKLSAYNIQTEIDKLQIKSAPLVCP